MSKPTDEDLAEVYAEIRKLVGDHVKRSTTLLELWRLWWTTFAAANSLDESDPDVRFIAGQLEQAYYAGAATVWELVTRVIPDAISEEEGERMLTRLSNELDAYTKRGIH